MPKLPANMRNVTGVVLLVVFVGLLAYDLLPFASEAEGDTISEVLHGAPAQVLLLVGYLLGHFWPLRVAFRAAWGVLPMPTYDLAELPDGRKALTFGSSDEAIAFIAWMDDVAGVDTSVAAKK